MSKLIRMFVLLLALVFTFGAASCAKAPVGLSPSGTAAFHARKVVRALDVLRDFAVDAEAQNPKVLSTQTTRIIVLAHREALRAIEAAPGGWRPVVEKVLETLSCSGGPSCASPIPEGDRQKILPYLALTRAVIQEVP